MSSLWKNWLNQIRSLDWERDSRAGKGRHHQRRRRRPLPAALFVEPLERRDLLSGTWTALTNLAPSTTGGIQNMMLLSDGTVMALGNPNAGSNGQSSAWYQLTPNSAGSYVNGTWSQLTSMNVQRLFFPSNVLQNGKVFVVGGEDSSSGSDTNTGEIFDPTANSGRGSWSNIATFPRSRFGDDPTEVLPNRKVLAGGGAYTANAGADYTWIYDPGTNSWSQTGTKLRRPGPNNTTVYDSSDEETWVKLPDGSILTYDNWASNTLNRFLAERYIPSTSQWVDASTLSSTSPPGLLSDSSEEIGPAFLLPDGRAFFLGTTGNTAFYTPSTNT